MRILWNMVICLGILFHGSAISQKAAPKKYHWHDPIGNFIQDGWTLSYLYPKSEMISFPHRLGPYCLNWVKLEDTVPGIRVWPKEERFKFRYRAVLCKVSDGRCPKIGDCEYRQKVKLQENAIVPRYVPLPEPTKVTDASGRVIEYDPEVRLESLLVVPPGPPPKDPTPYKEFIPGNHAALMWLEMATGERFHFCSIPLKVTGDANRPTRIPNIFSCHATMKDGVATCPGLEQCLKSPLDSDEALMAARKLEPDAFARADGRKKAGGKEAPPAPTHQIHPHPWIEEKN